MGSMLGIIIQKHIMAYKIESNREAVERIRRAILQCDFELVKLEDLSILRTVLRQHSKDGSPICAFVASKGESALWTLECPEYYSLVYELAKLPQIDERLAVMLFRLSFNENLEACQRNLETIDMALSTVKANTELLRRLFVTAHRLGQSLGQQETRGFQLSTLEKLSQTKSTKMPHLAVLHFVLALMESDDVEKLFAEGDVVLLRNAAAIGTRKVVDECRELALGLYGVKNLCDSDDHDRPLAEDAFRRSMQEFVFAHIDEVDEIAVASHHTLLTYKELAVFFDDLKNVYPPPRKEAADARSDFIEVFYQFAKTLPRFKHEVELEGLRDIVIGPQQNTTFTQTLCR